MKNLNSYISAIEVRVSKFEYKNFTLIHMHLFSDSFHTYLHM